jgi:hypothetical protein
MTKTQRIQQGRANPVLETWSDEDGHWVHTSDILPGDDRYEDAVREIRGY